MGGKHTLGCKHDMRFKNRYLLCRIFWADGSVRGEPSERKILLTIKALIADNFGDVGMGKSALSIQVKYFSPATSLCLIRCDREVQQQVRCALTLLTALQSQSCMVHVVHSAGSIRTARQAALQHDKTIRAAELLKGATDADVIN